MMRTLACLFLGAAAAVAQTFPLGTPDGKAIGGDPAKAKNVTAAQPHIHPYIPECKGKPDHVYARSGDVYYACIDGKDVCSQEKNVTIPASYIEAFQAKEREYDATMAASRATLERTKRDIQARGTDRPLLRPAPSTHSTSTVAVKTAHVSDTDLSRGAAPPPIQDDQLKGLEGVTRAELVQKLGPPQMKMSGDVENYTYMLASGNSAQIELTNGKVTHVQLVRLK